MPTGGGVERRDAVHTQRGALFSLAKEGSSAHATGWVGLENTVLADISQTQKNKQYTISLI